MLAILVKNTQWEIYENPQNPGPEAKNIKRVYFLCRSKNKQQGSEQGGDLRPTIHNLL